FIPTTFSIIATNPAMSLRRSSAPTNNAQLPPPLLQTSNSIQTLLPVALLSPNNSSYAALISLPVASRKSRPYLATKSNES
ncbi:10821_t:CDS:2, partial [Acaulospora colombiana]